MIIKNFIQLATTPVRKQALLIAEAGLEAINTTRIMQRDFSYDAKSDTLYIKGQKFDLSKYKRVLVVGGGKVVAEAAVIIEQQLGSRLSAGLVIDLVASKTSIIQGRIGTHPLPSSANVSATQEMISMLSECTENDLVIAVIAGGGSSLMCAPAEITLDEERQLTKTLMHSGASIIEINTVRKHMSLIKGGGLAKFAHPATVIGLIFSDVPGDDLTEVASGPTFKDDSTINDAMAILQKYSILQKCSMDSCGLTESPKASHYFDKVTNIMFCSAKDALNAMVEKSKNLGLKPRIWQTAFEGEASVLAKTILDQAKPGECLLAAGESVVTIPPDAVGGSGGRNQEMALSAMTYIDDNAVFAAIASDGHDNSDVAGAIVDLHTKRLARKTGVNVQEYLKRHDEYQLMLDLSASLVTGLTGSNVSDFIICIKE